MNFQLSVAGRGHLAAKNGANGMVDFRFDTADRCPEGNGRIFGDPDLIHRAWRAGPATLAVLGTKFPIKFTAAISSVGYVTIDGGSILRLLVPFTKPPC